MILAKTNYDENYQDTENYDTNKNYVDSENYDDSEDYHDDANADIGAGRCGDDNGDENVKKNYDDADANADLGAGHSGDVEEPGTATSPCLER